MCFVLRKLSSIVFFGIIFSGGVSSSGDVQAAGLVLKQYFEKSAPYICDDQGALGCSLFLYIYDDGEGVKQNKKNAVDLYTQACSDNKPDACQVLAWMYMEGDGVDQDIDRAFAMFKIGCDGNDMQFCSDLGWAYDTGTGTDVEYGEGSRFISSCL